MAKITREGIKTHKRLIELYSRGFQIEWLNVDGEWIPCKNPAFSPNTQYRVATPEYLKIEREVSWTIGHKGAICKVISENRYPTPFGESFEVRAEHLGFKERCVLSLESCSPATKEEWAEAFPIVELSLEEVAEICDFPVEKVHIVYQ